MVTSSPWAGRPLPPFPAHLDGTGNVPAQRGTRDDGTFVRAHRAACRTKAISPARADFGETASRLRSSPRSTSYISTEVRLGPRAAGVVSSRAASIRRRSSSVCRGTGSRPGCFRDRQIASPVWLHQPPSRTACLDRRCESSRRRSRNRPSCARRPQIARSVRRCLLSSYAGLTCQRDSMRRTIGRSTPSTRVLAGREERSGHDVLVAATGVFHQRTSATRVAAFGPPTAGPADDCIRHRDHDSPNDPNGDRGAHAAD